MNLKILSDSVSGFVCLQRWLANVLKLLPWTLCLIALLAGGTSSCVKQPNTKSGGSGVGQATTPAPAYVVQDLVQYARPLCGTAADGDLYPGATAPFGMIQWSPDTGSGRHCGGYAYEDSSICGFSLDHLSGAGCNYGGNFAFMPAWPFRLIHPAPTARLSPPHFPMTRKRPSPVIISSRWAMASRWN